MLSIGGDRTANPKGSGSLPVLWLNYATANIVFFGKGQLLILEDIDHHQKFINSSLYHPRPLHKISIHNFLSNVVPVCQGDNSFC